MAPTASLIAPKACATTGSLIRITAVSERDGQPDGRLPQRHRAAILAEHPGDREQRDDAECRLQLQHDFPHRRTKYGAAAFEAQCHAAGMDVDNAARSPPPIMHVVAGPGGRGRSAQAALPDLLPAVAKPVAILEPDRRGRDRLADLRPHRQRLRSRHGRPRAVPADCAAGVRRGPRRRSLRAQARGAGLPGRGSVDRAVSRLGLLCRLAHRGPHLHRDLRARHRGRIRKPGDRGAAAADRAAGHAAACHRDLERRDADRDHHRSRARRARLCGRAGPAVWDHARVLVARHALHRRDPGRAGAAEGCGVVRTISLPA